MTTSLESVLFPHGFSIAPGKVVASGTAIWILQIHVPEGKGIPTPLNVALGIEAVETLRALARSIELAQSKFQN